MTVDLFVLVNTDMVPCRHCKRGHPALTQECKPKLWTRAEIESTKLKHRVQTVDDFLDELCDRWGDSYIAGFFAEVAHESALEQLETKDAIIKMLHAGIMTPDELRKVLVQVGLEQP